MALNRLLYNKRFYCRNTICYCNLLEKVGLSLQKYLEGKPSSNCTECPKARTVTVDKTNNSSPKLTIEYEADARSADVSEDRDDGDVDKGLADNDMDKSQTLKDKQHNHYQHTHENKTGKHAQVEETDAKMTLTRQVKKKHLMMSHVKRYMSQLRTNHVASESKRNDQNHAQPARVWRRKRKLEWTHLAKKVKDKTEVMLDQIDGYFETVHNNTLVQNNQVEAIDQVDADGLNKIEHFVRDIFDQEFERWAEGKESVQETLSIPMRLACWDQIKWAIRSAAFDVLKEDNESDAESVESQNEVQRTVTFTCNRKRCQFRPKNFEEIEWAFHLQKLENRYKTKTIFIKTSVESLSVTHVQRTVTDLETAISSASLSWFSLLWFLTLGLLFFGTSSSFIIFATFLYADENIRRVVKVLFTLLFALLFKTITDSQLRQIDGLVSENVGKITYDTNCSLGRNVACPIYKGVFESQTDAAVRLVRLDWTIDINVLINNRQHCDTRKHTNVRAQLEEIKVHKALHNDSENIVKYLCCEKVFENGMPFLAIAYELCTWNLDEFVRARLFETSNNLRPIDAGKQLMKGLDFLHRMNYVHRDINPSNVLIRKVKEKYVFKLADMASCAHLTPVTGDQTKHRLYECASKNFGKKGWIAPEVQNMLNATSIVAYTSKSDVFPLGLIIYFTLTDGKKLFRSQLDIQVNTMDRSQMYSIDYPSRDLIFQMTDASPNNRPNTVNCLNHPALWPTKKTLQFYKSASDTLNANRLSTDIETGASNVVTAGGWRQQLSSGVEKELFKNKFGPTYKAKSVKSLLRSIRNSKDHFNTISPCAQQEFGDSVDKFLHYWSTRFPHLLMHTYNALKLHSTIPELLEYY